MSYASKKRYKSRREKFDRQKRNTRIILLFALIALLVLIYKNRYPIYDYLRVYFM